MKEYNIKIRFVDKEDLVQYKKPKNMAQVSYSFLKSLYDLTYLAGVDNLYGNIIYNMLSMEEYLKYLNQSDKTVLKALEILEKEEAFPKAPEQKLEQNEGTEKTVIWRSSSKSEKPRKVSNPTS